MDVYVACAIAALVAAVLSIVSTIVKAFTYEDEKEGHKHEQTKRQS